MRLKFQDAHQTRIVIPINELLLRYTSEEYIGCILLDDEFLTIENVKARTDLKCSTKCVPVLKTDIMVPIDANQDFNSGYAVFS